MNLEGHALQDLLSAEAKKQKQSYRRATVAVVIAALVGIGWLAFSAYNVVKLERKSQELKTKSGELQKNIEAKKKELENKQKELADTTQNLEVQKTLVAAAQQTLEDPGNRVRAKETLQILTKAINAPKVADPRENAAERTGFIDATHYRGHDKTLISIEVIPDSDNIPVTSFTYALDGTSVWQTPKGKKFDFQLDKSKHNPSRLLMFLDFNDKEPAGYTIKIKASDGSSSTTKVSPVGKATKTIAWVFDIM